MFEETIAHSGKRLDAWLTEFDSTLSRARWQSLIKEDHVTVNGLSVKKNFKLRKGDHVVWRIPEPVSTKVLPEEIPMDILHEDSNLIVVNKAAGLVVHPAAGNETGTLVNALLHHCNDLSGIGGEKRPGIVHRLDKDTSGVIIVAKNDKTHNALSSQFKNRETEKEYMAIVRGVPSPRSQKIETTIGRHPLHRKKMAADVRHGRHAISSYTIAEEFSCASLVKVHIETGRTHQIRVHMAHVKHPILGDRLYARPKPLEIWPNRQMLHAAKLTLAHPDSGERLSFQAPLPPDMDETLHHLRAARFNNDA